VATSDTAGQAEASEPASLEAARPRYLHEATAAALGLHDDAGSAIPSIVDALVGEGGLQVHRRRLRVLLQHPPTARAARLIHDAISCDQAWLLFVWNVEDR
jgi:hypothetical protein